MNFLRTVAALCSGFRPYRAYRDQGFSTSLKYLLQLMMVLGLLVTLSVIPWAWSWTREFAEWADANLPRFSIREGKLVSDAPQPYSTTRDDAVFILDTTGQVTAPDPNAVSGVLFTADKVVVWFANTNVSPPVIVQRDVPLTGFPDGDVNAAYWRRLMRSTLALATPLLWGLFTLMGLLTALLQAYLFSLVASFMERSLPRGMTLAQLLSIAMLAVTPGAIIVAAYMAMRLQGLNLWLIYLVAYGIFLIGATNACRDADGDGDPRDADDPL